MGDDESAAVSLNELAVTGKLGLLWQQDKQTFYCDSLVYTHEGPTKTRPTHDLAHLFIAANDAMPWAPIGGDEAIRMAEYNAVFLENLLCNAHYFVDGRVAKPSILSTSIQHARWFVEKHYVPFPVPAEEAYRRFCWGIVPSTISRLAPLFFSLREQEQHDPQYGVHGIELHFSRDDNPSAEGDAVRFSDTIHEVLAAVARSAH
jgi:hypothetical protein